MKANGMKTGDLIGSYICRIPYSAPYDLDYSGIITGYSFKMNIFLSRKISKGPLESIMYLKIRIL